MIPATSQPHHHTKSRYPGHIYDENCDEVTLNRGLTNLDQPPILNNIRGKNMNVCYSYGGTENQRQLVEKAVAWCFKRLTPRHSTLCVNVELEDDLDVHGDCSKGGERNEFDISILKTLKGDDFLTTIFHEMVHVMQYAKGYMKDKNSEGTKVYWKGYDYSNYPYSKQPWERQAFRMQEILLKEWKKDVRNN